MSTFELASSMILKFVIAAMSIVLSGIVLPWLRDTAIPWLTEKRLYNLCKQFVQAAEKLAESGALAKEDKKKYVVDLLTAKGVLVTEEIEAFIESAVEELDIAINAGMDMIVDEFEYTDGDMDEEDMPTEEAEG